MRLFESLEFDGFLHSQRRSSDIYTPVMSGFYDTFYDDERGLIGLVCIGLKVFATLLLPALG